MPLEKPVLPIPRFFSDFGLIYAGNAIVAFLFAASAPVAIILSVGTRGGLSESDMASWIFGALFVNSLITITFSLLYRQPLAFFWAIPGTVLVGPALTHLSFPEVIGAFLVTGVLMLVLGLTGWVRRAMEAVPMPVVMAMVAGVFLRFGVDLVAAFRDGFWIAMPMALAFFALSAWGAAARHIPPLIAALVVGAIAVWRLDSFNPPAGALFAFAAPNLYMPQFSWPAMVELVIPFAIAVLVVQNAQGFAILTARGHQPPINAITVACGLGSIVVAFVGTVSTCLTGPCNAILASSGEKERHYSAAVFMALLAMLFGLMAPLVTRLLLATPPAFISTLAGLAMLRTLQGAFQTAFRDKFSFGALICFLVTVADIQIFQIGAAFWGLVFGLAATYLLERDDLKANETPKRP